MIQTGKEETQPHFAIKEYVPTDTSVLPELPSLKFAQLDSLLVVLVLVLQPIVLHVKKATTVAIRLLV